MGGAIERLGLEQYRQEFPGRAFASEMGGAIAPALLSRGRTAPESLAMSTGKGTGLGFVSGAGAGEGTLGERAEEGLFGAAMRRGGYSCRTTWLAGSQARLIEAL
jgi:hypothetical protein